MATYATYLALCTAHGLRPLSYTAWAHLQPLVEANF
jgi:hypothetical protein